MSLPFERPEKHTLDPDPTDPKNCLRCGDARGWGVLHLEPAGAFDTDDPAPEMCRACRHWSHRGRACDGACSGGAACECRGAA